MRESFSVSMNVGDLFKSSPPTVAEIQRGREIAEAAIDLSRMLRLGKPNPGAVGTMAGHIEKNRHAAPMDFDSVHRFSLAARFPQPAGAYMDQLFSACDELFLLVFRAKVCQQLAMLESRAPNVVHVQHEQMAPLLDRAEEAAGYFLDKTEGATKAMADAKSGKEREAKAVPTMTDMDAETLLALQGACEENPALASATLRKIHQHIHREGVQVKGRIRDLA